MQVTVRFWRTPWGWSGASHLSSTNLTGGFAARKLFRIPSCREGTIHLQTSMPSPGFEPRPYGTAVSVTEYHTGWAADINISFKLLANIVEETS
ncbi:hypothetical protein TNCV_654161 [Trichonephila clavipes]|nr:hypothetical protein TNCV_654161 [Trichonephila clavipes]